MVLNSRGCARTKITTPQLFCGISTDDVRRLVELVHKEQPKRRIYLIGFSLGAAIVANYLGQEGEDTAVTAAATLACPWDFVHCFSYLEHTYLGKNVYSARMAQNLLKLVKNHRQTLADHPVVQEGRKHPVRYMHEFDEMYTAPLLRLRYQLRLLSKRLTRKPSHQNSCANPNPQLSRRPHCRLRRHPYPEVKANPYTFMATTSLGGHLGWFYPRNSGRWYPAVVADYLNAFHSNISHDKSKFKADIKPRKRLFNGERLVLD
jgi:predicted alpha/beta-fold hydrolase